MTNISSSPRVINCTFANNDTDEEGAGMYNLDSSPVVRNCVFWNNASTGGTAPQIFDTGTSAPDVSSCLIEGGYPGGTSILDQDPRFFDQDGADNVAGNDDDDLHLVAGSPCIDAGTNGVTGLPAIDFEGNVRIWDGNADGTAVIDLGADEYVAPCECDLNADGRCDMRDWLLFGQDWGRTNCNVPGTPACECDLNHDGRCDMRDWLLFGQDWGRTDCPVQ
jgi:hypothetical protein